ncbi:MAG: glycosyltransferase [bacterium]|nr:glycosyltransferase [bacterium]
MKKKISVSVGIPAYNEEDNIGLLLKEVLEQEEKDFVFREILIVSDGSNDKTVEEAKKVSDPRIKIFDNKTRQGKASRLNEIFNMADGELLVLFDADIQIISTKTIYNLVSVYKENPNTGLLCGNAIPAKGESMVQKAVASSVAGYDLFRREWHKGNNIYSCKGPLMALARNFYLQASIPIDVFGNDAYIYLLSKSLGFGFKFVESAPVGYRLPSTFYDQVKQNQRFISSRRRLRKYFEEALINREYAAPKIKVYKALLKQFLKSPFYSLLIFLINFYCRLALRFTNKGVETKWIVIKTTKGGFRTNG